MNNTSRKQHLISGIVAGLISVLLLVGSYLLFVHRQYVMDVASYWSYRPTSDIASINDRVDFSQKGVFYFYVTHPEIADSTSFNEDCPRQEATSPILGCYANDRVYIFDVTNEQLDGIEEVTAAHEMLHAVWQRMDQQTKDRMTVLLNDAYKKNSNAELEERVAYYERNEPGELANELHSILATEVPNLGDELEAYYAQFFNDRQKVLDLHEQYNSVFTDLKSQATTLYDELQSLSAQITADSASYNSDVTQLEQDIQYFNQRANNGDFASQAAFQAERSALLARSRQLEADRSAINASIDGYNTKYQTYQEIGKEIDSLNKSIDSFSTPQEAPSL